MRQKERLYDVCGIDRTVFIRPNRGDKIFTGKMVYKEDFEKVFSDFRCSNITPEELVIVSEPRNLLAEWRFIVVNGEIVSGSQYKKGEACFQDANVPTEAYDFAREILFYNPEPAWVIDVCLTKQNEYRLMEVGCFSCAGLYKCDRVKVVDRVSQAALAEWTEIYS